MDFQLHWHPTEEDGCYDDVFNPAWSSSCILHILMQRLKLLTMNPASVSTCLMYAGVLWNQIKTSEIPINDADRRNPPKSPKTEKSSVKAVQGHGAARNYNQSPKKNLQPCENNSLLILAHEQPRSMLEEQQTQDAARDRSPGTPLTFTAISGPIKHRASGALAF